MRRQAQRCLLSCALGCLLWSTIAGARTPREHLNAAKTWAYQLQNVQLQTLRESPYDVIVLDLENDRKKPWQPAEIESLRKRDGSPRVVLAYLSVGEAENYRSYWKPEWSRRAPTWLGAENPSWRGNFFVKYWEPGWQDVLFRFGGMLDQVIGAGFDGVYLDRLDIYMRWGPKGRGVKGRPDAARAMVDLVTTLKAHAVKKRARPDFLVLGQNAPLLCEYPGYVDAVDAVALEDLFYRRRRGRDGSRQSRSYTRFILESLAPLRKVGAPIFVVDYLPRRRDRVRYPSLAQKHGLVPFAAPSRALNRLP